MTRRETGEEISAETERQTACGSMVEPKRMGQRGAVVAGTMPG